MLAGCNNASTGGSSGGAISGGAISGGETIATAGSTNIGREDLHAYLEANGGPQALAQLIDFELLMQHAKANGIEITEAQVQAEIDERTKANKALKDVVAKGGVQLDAFKRAVRYEKAVSALLTKDVKVDAAKQAKWFKDESFGGQKTHKRYDVPDTMKAGLLLTSTKTRADYLAQQLKKGKTFLELVNEQKKVADPAAQSSTNDTAESAPPGQPDAGFIPLEGLPIAPAQLEAVKKLQPNQTSGVLKLQTPNPTFIILKMIEFRPGKKAQATDPQPMEDYKLTLVAQQENAKNPQNPKDFNEVLTRMQQQMQQQNMQQMRFEPVSYRDIITAINQAALGRLMEEVRKKNKVTITDANYADVNKIYNPEPVATVPAPGSAPGGAAGNAAPGGATDTTGAAGNSAPAAPATP